MHTLLLSAPTGLDSASGCAFRPKAFASAHSKASKVFFRNLSCSQKVKSSQELKTRLISAHSLPPLMAAEAHSIGFRRVVCCLCIDLTLDWGTRHEAMIVLCRPMAIGGACEQVRRRTRNCARRLYLNVQSSKNLYSLCQRREWGQSYGRVRAMNGPLKAQAVSRACRLPFFRAPPEPARPPRTRLGGGECGT